MRPVHGTLAGTRFAGRLPPPHQPRPGVSATSERIPTPPCTAALFSAARYASRRPIKGRGRRWRAHLCTTLGLNHIAGRQVLGRKVCLAAPPLAQLAQVAGRVGAAQVPAGHVAGVQGAVGWCGRAALGKVCPWARHSKASAAAARQQLAPLTGSHGGTPAAAPTWLKA